MDMRPPNPPLLPPLPSLDWTISFMMVIPALLTASCLFPLAAPPELSKSLEASAMAREIKSDCEFGFADPPPPVNFFMIYGMCRRVRSGMNVWSEGIAVGWTVPARQQRNP